ncbi:hypothetical protein KSP39_PZI004099 [Platanthera zijinensis]|uniref:Uncharacterized protein n=1 Tax=Platanthera zijinensis TaxID=2320716 RepID=A0AAP0BVA6_9ASPA
MTSLASPSSIGRSIHSPTSPRLASPHDPASPPSNPTQCIFNKLGLDSAAPSPTMALLQEKPRVSSAHDSTTIGFFWNARNNRLLAAISPPLSLSQTPVPPLLPPLLHLLCLLPLLSPLFSLPLCYPQLLHLKAWHRSNPASSESLVFLLWRAEVLMSYFDQYTAIQGLLQQIIVARVVSWEGDGAPFKETDEDITHQVLSVLKRKSDDDCQLLGLNPNFNIKNSRQLIFQPLLKSSSAGDLKLLKAYHPSKALTPEPSTSQGEL